MIGLILSFGAGAGLSVASGDLGKRAVFGYYLGAWVNKGPFFAQGVAEGFTSRGEGAYRVSAASAELGAAWEPGPWRLAASAGPGFLWREHLNASEGYPVFAASLSAGLFLPSGPGISLLVRFYPGKETFLYGIGLGAGYRR